MIDLDLMFNRDFECEYNNTELIIDNKENDKEIEITKEIEKVFSDGIDDFYRFANEIK